MRATGHARGLGVPTATDIAFALAVLAVLSTHLPAALRTFLLTLAVVDDLLAITVIAVFYTDHLTLGPLALALVPIGAVRVCACSAVCSQWWLLVPLAVVDLGARARQSGCTPPSPGVVLGFTVPVLRARQPADPTPAGLAERFEHLMRPVSAGFAVPVFAFFAAGVTVGGLPGSATALRDPVTLGVIAGLVIGKTPRDLRHHLAAGQVHPRQPRRRPALASTCSGVSMLAGIGFTVSLLIGELAFGYGPRDGADVKIAVLVGSVVAASAGRGRVAEPQRRLPRAFTSSRPPTPTTTACPTSTRLDRTDRCVPCVH